MASSATQLVFVISCMVCIFSQGQGTVFHRSAIPAEFLDPENFPSGQHPPIASGEECELVNIPTQENFNSTRFAGKWYLISDYNVDGQVVSNFIDIDDVQAIFHARPRGNMKIQTGIYQGTQFPIIPHSSRIHPSCNSHVYHSRHHYGKWGYFPKQLLNKKLIIIA